MKNVSIIVKIAVALIVLQVARFFPHAAAPIMLFAGFFFAKALTVVVASGERSKIIAMLVAIIASASSFLLIEFGIWKIQIPAMTILAFATLGVGCFLVWTLVQLGKDKK